MEQYPTADEVGARFADHYHKLAYQYQPHKSYAAVVYAEVHYALGHQRQDNLKQTAEPHAQGYLQEVAAVLVQIAEQERERPPGAHRLIGAEGVEIISRLEKHGYAQLPAVAAGAEPVGEKFLFRQLIYALRRVGDMIASALLSEKHHKMPLLPIDDTRHRTCCQVLSRQPCTLAAQAYRGGSVVDTLHRYSLIGGAAVCAELGKAYLLAEIAAYHGKAGDATLHGVVLPHKISPLEFYCHSAILIRDSRLCSTSPRLIRRLALARMV